MRRSFLQFLQLNDYNNNSSSSSKIYDNDHNNAADDDDDVDTDPHMTDIQRALKRRQASLKRRRQAGAVAVALAEYSQTTPYERSMKRGLRHGSVLYFCAKPLVFCKSYGDFLSAFFLSSYMCPASPGCMYFFTIWHCVVVL